MRKPPTCAGLSTRLDPTRAAPPRARWLAAALARLGLPVLALLGVPMLVPVAHGQSAQGQAAQGQGTQGQTVTIAVGSAYSSVDPHYHALTPNSALNQHLFDYLVHHDSDLKPVPGLAVSWRALDPTTWEFKLRQGVTWHDGTPFTADDVLFTFARVPEVRNSPSNYTIYTRQVSSVEAVDAHTLIMKTPAPYPVLPNNFGNLAIVGRMLTKDVQAPDFNSGKAAIGTGPYRFVSYTPGDRIVFERNDSWWGERQPWARVVYRMITNDTSRIAALKAGDVDMIDTVPTRDVDSLKADPKLRIASKPGVRNIYLYLDQNRDDTPFVTGPAGEKLGRNPLKDQRVRRALSLAINRDGIVRQVMSGQASPSGQFLPAGTMGHVPELVPDPNDPDAARKLLAEAGYPQGFRVTLHGPNDRYVNDAAIVQAIAQMWTRIGVRTQVEVMPSNVFFTRSGRNEFSAGLLGWGTGTGEPDHPMIGLIATIDAARGRGTANRSLYSNPTFDAALDRALAVLDPEARAIAYAEPVTIAIRDYAIVPLHHQVNLWAMRQGLQYDARNDERTMAMGLRPVQ